MSNGKKWKDGHKVHRDHRPGHTANWHVGGSNHKHLGGWWYRNKMNTDKYGDFEMTHMSMRRPTALEIWGWD